MKCLECNKDLKSITNTHLLKCCGLTMKEYSIKHCIPMESLRSQDQICIKLSEETKKEIVRKSLESKKSKQIKKFNYEEAQVIIGSLLGDGYFHINKNCTSSTYLILEQGIKQLNYLWWKGLKLKRLDPKFYQYYKFNQIKHRYTTRNQIRTKSLFAFGNLIPYFYKSEGGKYINPKILNHIEAQALAIWFMDDGTHTIGLTWGALATQSFSIEDNKLLCQFFKNKFDIEPKILFDGKQKPYLFFNKQEFNKLKKIIEPYMFHEMLYKIDKEKFPECIVTKKIIFDSSHFLDEYDGKCSQLHGGRYELLVSIKGPINPETGMVIDYGYIKTILDKYVVETFDHHCINYSINKLGWRSTTELICIYLWKVLIEFFPTLYKLELYETEGSKCEYFGPSLEEMKKNKNLDILKIFKEKDIKYSKRIITNLPELFSNVDENHFDDSEKITILYDNKHISITELNNIFEEKIK